MGFFSVYLINVNLDGVNFHEDDCKTMIYVWHMAWENRYKQCKACTKWLANNWYL